MRYIQFGVGLITYVIFAYEVENDRNFITWIWLLASAFFFVNSYIRWKYDMSKPAVKDPSSSIATPINKITDEMYIEVYDKIGCKYFCKGNDQQLKEWGHSEDKIKEIKVKSVKCEIDFYSRGIGIYKLVNKLCGGKNAL